MARDTKQHIINGFKYDITQLGAKAGRTVLARVLRVVAAASEGNGEEAFAKFANAMTDEQLDYLCETFAKTTMVGPEGQDRMVPLSDCFDNHFAGKYGDMLKWLWAAMETNYASFLSEMGLDAEALKAKAAEMMIGGSPASPTPQSGTSSSSKSGG